MMWEIAILIIAVAFVVLVAFTIPALLQIRDSAKEFEFTLRETRETIKRIREISEKAEDGIEKGRQAVMKLDKTLTAIDQTIGGSTLKVMTKPLSALLEFAPVILSASKIYKKYLKRR